MKKLGVIGIAFIVIILGCEIYFAQWLQSMIDSAIPKNEYYNLIHIVTLIAHIFMLGGIYLGVAFYAVFGFILLIND